MADALDSGSSGSLSCVGSSPILRTMKALEIQGLFFLLSIFSSHRSDIQNRYQCCRQQICHWLSPYQVGHS